MRVGDEERKNKGSVWRREGVNNSRVEVCNPDYGVRVRARGWVQLLSELAEEGRKQIHANLRGSN